MASTIKLKTGTGSAVPSSLTQGEVAINVDNGLIYYGSGSVNSVKKLESFTHITASGDISARGDVYGTNLYATARIYANLGAGTDNSVVVLSGIGAAAQLATDEIDSAVWGATGAIVTVEGEAVAPLATSAATVTTAAQPNITSLGTLTSITSTGNSALGNAVTDTHTFTGHITASGNVSASGKVYSDNEEILINGSFRSTTLATGEYAYPANQGVMSANWSNESAGGPPAFSNAHVQGIVVPFSCSLVGAVFNINSNQAGTGSLTLWAEDMSQGMGTSGHTPDIIFESYAIHPAGNKNYQFEDRTGITGSASTEYDILTPNMTLVPSWKNVAGSQENISGHYCVLIKRR